MNIKTILIIIGIVIFAPYVVFYVQHLRKGDKIPRPVKYRPPSLVKQLYIELPKTIVNDIFNKKYGEFLEKGVHLICGEIGRGKSVTIAYLLREWKKCYPYMKIRTNMSYSKQDFEINDWRDILESTNGIYGEVDVIDEIQNWFDCLESKDFPPSMLGEVSQLRKDRKVIMGSTQVFGRVSKPLREQAFYYYVPYTLFNALVIVFKYKPKFDDLGNCVGKKLRKVFAFVQTEDIRNSYDTYKKIQKISLKGFKPFSEQLSRYNERNKDVVSKG